MFNYIIELYNEMYYYTETYKINYNNINTSQSYYYYSDISNQICSCENDTFNFDIDIDNWKKQILEKKEKDMYNIYVTNLYRNEYANILNNNNNIK